MEQQIAYQVIVTTDWRLNIILTNKRKEQLRSYSHFVTQEQAAQFAHTLENTVLLGHYTKLTTCPLCGKAFFRQDKLSQMRDGRILHQRCLDRATKQGKLSVGDCEQYRYRCFPEDIPLFDYSSLTSETNSRDFRYAIQTVSKDVIHLFLIEPWGSITRRICLTYDECLGLIKEIRRRLSQLADAALAPCSFCGQMAYIDKTNYLLASGELIHGNCMERFLQSRKAAKAKLPAIRLPMRDVFGHHRLFREKFDTSPF